MIYRKRERTKRKVHIKLLRHKRVVRALTLLKERERKIKANECVTQIGFRRLNQFTCSTSEMNNMQHCIGKPRRHLRRCRDSYL